MIDNVVVTAIGVLLIGFIYWFFLMKKTKVIAVKDSVTIIVEGGYNPEVISVRVNQTTILKFLRKDSSSCLEDVVLPEFKIRAFLPLNEEKRIEIHPTKPGEYEIVCGMNMFHGRLLVAGDSLQ